MLLEKIPPLAALGRDDNEVTFLRIRLQFPERFRHQRTLISQGYALPASPAGKRLYRTLGCWSLSDTVPSFQVRNGTQAVPYGSADWCVFLPMYSKNGHIRRPNNCQLSTVNCQLSQIVNCPLSIVNFLSFPNAKNPQPLPSGSVGFVYQPKSSDSAFLWRERSFATTSLASAPW